MKSVLFRGIAKYLRYYGATLYSAIGAMMSILWPRWLSSLTVSCLMLVCSLSVFASESEADTPKAVGRANVAVFAGGCWRCWPEQAHQLPGIRRVVLGAAASAQPNWPRLLQGLETDSDTVLAAWIEYDPDRLHYGQLLRFFMQHIDLEQPEGQFCEFGPQIKRRIFTTNAYQQRLAEQGRYSLMRQLPQTAQQIEIIPLSSFYAAPQMWQDYHQQKPVSYWLYKQICHLPY